jgi:hypothetical protein
MYVMLYKTTHVQLLGYCVIRTLHTGVIEIHVFLIYIFIVFNETQFM